MKIKDITALIEQYAPLRLQEEWDNTGMQVGDPEAEATGALLCTDATEAVVAEAVKRGWNLVISHHPLIFHGLKKIIGATPTERTVLAAIKHGVAVYSAHTNMDNAPQGVSWRMAQKLGMTRIECLDPHPVADMDIGTVAGGGVVGDIEPTPARQWLEQVKQAFEVGAVRCSGNLDQTLTRVALCGGSGAFLIGKAVEHGAQVFVSADIRYHELLDNNPRILLADIGHYESEHYTKEIFLEIIQKKYPTFATAFASDEKNQIKYL